MSLYWNHFDKLVGEKVTLLTERAGEVGRVMAVHVEAHRIRAICDSDGEVVVEENWELLHQAQLKQ